MSATYARPTIELPPGARQLGSRAVAKRLGVTADTAERLLSEGRLIAYTTAERPLQVHLSPAHAHESAVTA